MQALLSHYRIQEQIGEGGQCPVYLAHDEGPLDRDVAVKILRRSLLAEEAARKRLHSEATALSKLTHPNIAFVLDFGHEDGTYYLVEEYIAGLSLAELLITAPLTEQEVVRLGTQLCQGAAAAHDQGIVHCDLKPGNIRVTPDARLKIIDFGIAKILQKEAREDSEETTTGPKAESPGGTRPYMSPEQIRDERVDARTDIWGIGCVLFEMATGLRPFRGTGKALEEAIQHQAVPLVTNFNPRMSPSLDGIIAKCLDKDRRKRYSSAREIVVDLRRMETAPEPEPRPKPSLWLRSVRCARRNKLIAVEILLLAMAVTLIPAPGPEQSPQSPTAITSQAPHDLYLRGMDLLGRWDKAGNPDAAIGLFQQAVKADANFALGYAALAEAYWVKYRLDRDSRWMEAAEMNCRLAAERNSQLPAVYVTLARVHTGKGEYNLALEEIQRALQLAPNDADALLAEAAVLAGLARAQEAEDLYRRATRLAPENWAGHYEFGAFYYRQRRFAEAAGQFQEVLDLTPDNAMAHATLGGMMQLLKRDADAETHLKRSLEIEPSYTAYTNLGALYYRERRWAESAEMTGKALEMNANDYSAWANLAIAYEWLGRKQEADQARRQELARLESVRKVRPGDPEVQANLAALYARLKQRDKALRSIEAALARAPEDPEVLSLAGETYEYLGERERAIEAATRALSKGWTLGQLENDPGYQRLIMDPRLQRAAGRNTQPTPGSQRP